MILRIPFTRSAYTGGTTPPWDQNDWFRAHGYELPLDTYLLLQWFAGLIVDVGFFGFMYHFITDEPIADATNTLITAWNPEQDFVQVVKWPWAAWSWQIMVAFSIGVKTFSITASFISTEEPVVATQRQDVPRSKTYVRKYGIPVVDSSTGVCGICRIKVPRSTRHCKLCNKCVAGMDHHCRWLNCCIGQRNYRLFMVLITYTFFALVWYSSVAVYTLWSSTYQKNLFAGQAWELFHSTYAMQSETMEIVNSSVSRSYYLSIGITVILAGLSLIGTIAMLRLLCFHIRLACMNTTTVEYINRTSHYRALYDDTDDEDDYSDDYYDDFSEASSGLEDDDVDEEEENVWKPSVASTPAAANKAATMLMTTGGGQYIVRSLRLLRKVGRPWRRLLRRYLPGYNRYHQLHQRRRRNYSHGTSLLSRGLSLISCRDTARTKRRRPRRRTRPLATNVRHHNVHMEEILATQTIRPIMTLDTAADEEGPDYNDNMGLDMTILDEKFTMPSPSPSSPASPMSKQRYVKSNKAARILDITDEEAVRYQQSHQDQRIQQEHYPEEGHLEKTDDIV